eukprot:TRINITY_DN13153_c0_g1_i2.p1 TRINITY_DN13153_c0_g1~~TRINITY_DN13153_c0_g1_i2.p1  ORF type:complete len:345 (-),score=51.76 TRINITY_DN13153_c0_g1_i2:41-1075(-)
MNEFRLTQVSSKIFQYIYVTMTFVIFVGMINAMLVQSLDFEKSNGRVHTIADLRGKKVLTFEAEYLINGLRRAKAIPVVLSYDTQIDDYLAYFLSQTDLEYLLLDTPLAQFYDTTSCDYSLAAYDVMPLYYVFNYPYTTSSDDIRNLTTAVTNVTGTTTAQQRAFSMISKMKKAECTKTSSDGIYFMDVYHLFIAFGGAICGGLTVSVIKFLLLRFNAISHIDGIRAEDEKRLYNSVCSFVALTLCISLKRVEAAAAQRKATFMAMKSIYGQELKKRMNRKGFATLRAWKKPTTVRRFVEKVKTNTVQKKERSAFFEASLQQVREATDRVARHRLNTALRNLQS